MGLRGIIPTKFWQNFWIHMHSTQKFPREKTFPKIRLNLSMPLLLWPGLVEYMGARGIVPTTFWQDFQISLQFDTKCFSILSLRPHQILRPSAVPALYEGRWREICVWPLLFQHILVQYTLDLRKSLGVNQIFLKSRFFLISNKTK